LYKTRVLLKKITTVHAYQEIFAYFAVRRKGRSHAIDLFDVLSLKLFIAANC